MSRLLVFLLPLMGLLMLGGCGDQNLVARCGDFELSVDDLRFEVSRIGPSYSFDDTPEERLKLVENLAARHILALMAVDMGLGEGAAEAALAGERRELGEAYMEWKIDESVRVPRAASLKWRRLLDRRIHAEDMLFRARKAADDALLSVAEGATYEDLERAYAGNDIAVFSDRGWVVWRDLDQRISLELFQTEKGRFSGVVTLPDGYHIYYVEDDSVLGVMDEVLFLRARKFERMIREAKLDRDLMREFMGRYDFEPDPEGVEAALEAFSMSFRGERPSEDLLEMTVVRYARDGEVAVADQFEYYFGMPADSRPYVGDAYGVLMTAWELALPELYVRAGRDMGMERMHRVKWAGEKAREDYLVPQMEDYYRSQIDVTDDMLEAYYAERKDDLRTPRTFHASRILLRDRSEARQVMRDLAAGEDFAALAETYSYDSFSGAKGGDLGPISFGIVAVYDSVVNTLEPGEVSEPFNTSAGIEMLKLHEIAGGQQLSYEEAIPYMEMFIRNQTANDMLAELVRQKKEELGFYLNEDLLMKIRLPIPDYRATSSGEGIIG